jgi:hypothetical protein
MDDGSEWVHLSASVKTGLPKWHTMVSIKETFLGDGCHAVQVIPPRASYINLTDCLHLWAKGMSNEHQ